MEQFSILAAVFLTAFIQTSAHYGCKFYIQYFSLTVHAVCNYSWQPKAKTHLRRKESNVKNHDSITSLLLGFGWWVGAVGRQWQPPDRIVPSNFILNLLRDAGIGKPNKALGLPQFNNWVSLLIRLCPLCYCKQRKDFEDLPKKWSNY